MSISEWSSVVTVAELQDEPILSDDLTEVIDRVNDCEDSPPGVVLNFANVSYLNSSNLAQLLELRKALLDLHAGLRLCELDETLLELFHVTGLNRIFSIDDTMTTALAMINMTDSSDDSVTTTPDEEE